MMNEHQYIQAAKSGDETAFSILFNKYKPIVFSLKKRYYLKGMDLDDWMQEGQIICYKSVQNYEIKKGLSFGYFFKMNMERHIFSLLRKQSAIKRTIDNQSISLDEKMEMQGENFTINEEENQISTLDYLILRERATTFYSQLSSFETKVFHQYVMGREEKDIANMLNCSQSKVKNAMDRTKRKLKDYLM